MNFRRSAAGKPRAEAIPSRSRDETAVEAAIEQKRATPNPRHPAFTLPMYRPPLRGFGSCRRLQSADGPGVSPQPAEQPASQGSGVRNASRRGHDAERACLDLKTHDLEVQNHHTGRIRVVGMNDKTRVPQVRARLLAEPADDCHPAVIPLVIDQHFPAQVMIEMDLVPWLLQQIVTLPDGLHPTPHRGARPRRPPIPSGRSAFQFAERLYSAPANHTTRDSFLHAALDRLPEDRGLSEADRLSLEAQADAKL